MEKNLKTKKERKNMEINRFDKRYIYLNKECDEYAIEKGCKYRCWLNELDMGGWMGDSLTEFEQAVKDELKYAGFSDENGLYDEKKYNELLKKCSFVELN